MRYEFAGGAMNLQFRNGDQNGCKAITGDFHRPD
jgi:hypothetical protein